MSFISNKERSKKLRKLTSGNLFRKWLLSSVILLSAVVMFLTFFSMLITLIDYPIINHPWVKHILIIDTNDEGNVYLTEFGFINLIFYAVLVVLNIIAFIVVLTMKSSRETFKQTTILTSTPLSGRKNKKNAAKTTKERVGIGA